MHLPLQAAWRAAAVALLLPGLAFALEGGSYWVKHAGEMRRVMRDRDFRTQIDTHTLREIPHLYALGPAENMDGEITIIDGVPYVAALENGKVSVRREFPKAPFLVYGRVDRWRSLSLKEPLGSIEALEKVVAERAKAAGLDMARPFPFLVRGTAEGGDYHVLRAGERPSFPFKRERVEVLGFYSDRHHGVFTHHGTNVHLHFRGLSGPASGYVDALLLAGNATLHLPAAPK